MVLKCVLSDHIIKFENVAGFPELERSFVTNLLASCVLVSVHRTISFPMWKVKIDEETPSHLSAKSCFAILILLCR